MKNENTKHTPGPWTEGKSYTTEKAIREPDGECVAEVCSLPEMEANALLIKAPPELLEALEEAERVIRHAVQESKGRVRAEIVGGWEYHADRVSQAIAEATGGAS